MSNSQNKKSEIEFFDKFGPQLDYDVFDQRGYDRIINEFLKYLDLNSRLKVVDFGCGTGAFTSKFSQYNFDLCGIDISPECIRFGSEKYQNIKFEIGDVENTQFGDNTVDVVLMSGLLHHFQDFLGVLREAKRILKPGGKILAYDPHRGNPVMWLYRCKESPLYSSVGVTENEQPLGKTKIESAIKEVGFFDSKVYAIAGITYKYVESKTTSRFLPIYNLFERIVDSTIFRKYIGSFLITYAVK